MWYSGLAAPAAIARWTGGNYLGITAVTAGATACCLVLWLKVPRIQKKATPSLLLGADLFFLVALALTLRSSQVSFSGHPSGYPILEPAVGGLGRVALSVMLLLSPVLFVQSARFAQAVVDTAPSVRMLGGGFALGSLYLLVATLAQVFTTSSYLGISTSRPRTRPIA